MEILKKRVRPANHKDVKNAAMYIGGKRKGVAEINLTYLLTLKDSPILLFAKHHHPIQKNYQPRIDKKDGVVANTTLQHELILKIGAKIMLVHNIDTADMLTNGQPGILREVIRTIDGKVQILVVELRDKRAGRENREKYQKEAAQFPGCVFIERIASIRKRGGDFGSTATVFQFPIRVAHAITAHKIQGQSILSPLTVAMDLSSVFQPAQVYVMLSRIQCLGQLIIVGELDEGKIRASEAALNELKRLEKISLNRNPTPWDTEHEDSLKIASLNCAGFFPHLKDLTSDVRLLQADVLHLDETSITSGNNVEDLSFNEHDAAFLNIGLGKGVAALAKKHLKYSKVEIGEPKLQVMRISLDSIDTINVYRSSDKSLVETSKMIHSLIDVNKPTLVSGDFNVCLRKNPSNEISKNLKECGFQQMVTQATHVEGGLIDHLYWLDKDNIWEKPSLEHYCPYYSDHDALLVTLKRRYYKQ